MKNLDRAILQFREGNPVLIYDADGREEETDIVIGSQFINPSMIKMMRKDGGGLICVTVPHSVAQKLGMPYLVEVFQMTGLELFKELYPSDIPYDTKSAFSITINHRKTFTGISDKDRALTISEFAKVVQLAQNNGFSPHMFGKIFRSPGHVPLLIAAKGLVKKRQGHTELSMTLARLAGIVPSTTIVEMLGDDGRSLSKKEAIKYADMHGLVFIEGKEIIERWNDWFV